jgi:hypothetical protein
MDQDTPDNIVAYRLGEVEKVVKENHVQINAKLDNFLVVRDDVTALKLQVLGLSKSRDRLISVVATIGGSTLLLFVNQVFNVLGK